MRRVPVRILLAIGIMAFLHQAADAQQGGMDRDSAMLQYFRPMFDRPIDPTQYLIRPGDKIRITFLRVNLPPLDLEVSPEGSIVHQSIGVVQAGGMTLAQARETLKAPLAAQFNAKDVSISVTEPRQVVISVTGAVARPGHYRTFNSSQVSQVIEMAGGVRPGGSTRRIVFSGGPNDLQVDLDRAQYLGDDAANPYLYAGFRVDVPAKTNRVVQVIGEVLTPREVELTDQDDLQTLVTLAGGPTRDADVKGAQILGSTGRDPHQAGSIQPGDIIRIPALGENSSAGVGIFGEVASPGRYLLQDGLTLEQLLTMAGGATRDGNVSRATVFRLAESDAWQTPADGRYPIDLSLNPEPGSLMLRPLDSVFVPKRLGWVRVSGLVKAPGLVPFVEGKDALFYVNATGGALDGANMKDIVVFNRVSRTSSTVPSTGAVRDGDEITVQAIEQMP